jgi:hypothetical protein
MTTYYSQIRTFVSAVAALDATADAITFAPAQPIDIKRWGYIMTETLKDASACTVALDHRVTAGTDTGRLEIDTIVLATGLALGKGVVKELVLPVAEESGSSTEDGSTRNVSGTGPLQVDPGEEVIFQVTDAASTGDVTFFLEYYELPINLDSRNTDNITVVTS